MAAAPHDVAPAAPLPDGRLRVLIADDEPLARHRLVNLLTHESDIEVIAECTNGLEAEAAIRALHPDVALLDVRMPGLDGLAVVRSLPPGAQRPVIIFVTAHEEHALRAFDLQAVDYLLKPCPPGRLRQALNRAWGLLASTPPPAEPRLQRLIVRMGERMIVVAVDTIDWIESADNYAILHFGRETHVLRETLTELETRLARGQFLRISRTAVVNLDRVREIQQEGGGHVMVLTGNVRIPITRGIREVQARLETG